MWGNCTPSEGGRARKPGGESNRAKKRRQRYDSTDTATKIRRQRNGDKETAAKIRWQRYSDTETVAKKWWRRNGGKETAAQKKASQPYRMTGGAAMRDVRGL